MLFNSLDFALFLPIVFVVYWLIPKEHYRMQNLWIALASYFFYGWWDWRFLSLIVLSTLVDYTAASQIFKSPSKATKNLWLGISLTVNLGLLGYFKYANFFIENFEAAFSFFGGTVSGNHLNIILPVGISFYTFQTLSYTLDVHKGKLKPSQDLIAFTTYVAFFPQLVAGPIERARHLLPQFNKPRTFDRERANDGLRQILWGLVKKVIIADNAAVYVNQIFEHHQEMSAAYLLLGMFLFYVQIYGDFSGYSDIAIGTARLFGITLSPNFLFPYFSRDFAELWRRWHISLTNWFRDYVYVPLMKNRNKHGKYYPVLIVFIQFTVTGFWHGAQWKYILWGVLLAALFVPTMFKDNSKRTRGTVAEGRVLPNFREWRQLIWMNIQIVFVLFIFRMKDIQEGISYLGAFFTGSGEAHLQYGEDLWITLVLIILFFVLEWLGRFDSHALGSIPDKIPKGMKWAFFYLLLFSILYFKAPEQEFIYFDF